MRHVSRLSRCQEALEDGVYIPRYATFDQTTGKVRTADEFRIRYMLTRPFETPRYAAPVELGCDRLRAVSPPRPQALKAAGERRVRRINAKADDVKRVTSPRDGNLHAINEGKTGRFGTHARLGQATDIVMIGEREDSDTPLGSALRHLSRAEQSVGARRVSV